MLRPQRVTCSVQVLESAPLLGPEPEQPAKAGELAVRVRAKAGELAVRVRAKAGELAEDEVQLLIYGARRRVAWLAEAGIEVMMCEDLCADGARNWAEGQGLAAVSGGAATGGVGRVGRSRRARHSAPPLPRKRLHNEQSQAQQGYIHVSPCSCSSCQQPEKGPTR